MNPTSATTAPITKKRTVSRGRLPNAHYRTREYLTELEVERLMKAAGENRHGHRDATMILWPSDMDCGHPNCVPRRNGHGFGLTK